jgi:N-acetyl sugar amidotransferase
MEYFREKHYRQCAISVMDTISDPDISFDEKGISNYYYDYLKQAREMVFTGAEADRRLSLMVDNIKSAGKGKRYDCITGVSGGVDSTYLALQAKKLGLRPLIVHFDNGWNSELAVQNIQNIISKLGFDLYTLVVDWNEFRDIQLAYFKASVVDIEAVTDHAIIATLYKLALENDIKFVLSGANVVTEAVLPRYWIFNKTDHRNLVDIHRKFGQVPLKTFPLFTTSMKKKVQLKGIQSLKPLNLMQYNKKAVKEEIIRELQWRDYGGKHYESVFTRFYQGYILPAKFQIDKRKAHLSNLVFSGQITRDEALRELETPIYDAHQLETDYDFVLKKLGFSREQFEQYIKLPRREHSEFKIEKSVWDTYLLLKPFKSFRASMTR